MPEARDRMERPVDYAAAFLSRRSNYILLDEPATELNMFGSPIRQGSMAARRGLLRSNFSNRRTSGRRGQTQFRSPHGQENPNARRGRNRVSNSVLPSWYPRTPLRDITTIVRAIERRRARMRDGVGRDIETLTPQQLGVLDSLEPLADAQLEPNYPMVTPGPSIGVKRPYPPSSAKVHQMLLDITRQNTGEDALTPQKKLLNSIDKVGMVVMEEIQKMKSTPSAKRAEREKRVRTLMSMR